MTAEAWTIIGTGIAILVAIATSNRSIRAEIKELRAHVYRLEERINEVEAKLTERINEVDAKLTERINEVEAKLTERINEVEAKLTERINQLEVHLRERLGRVEGTLDVIRDSMFNRHDVA
ncbi:MAG: hypothetical protein OXK76_09455 [Gammaproteobacteria bacterium]|nr:hypothetical protein [Gammaproteobacteria bacterium]